MQSKKRCFTAASLLSQLPPSCFPHKMSPPSPSPHNAHPPVRLPLYFHCLRLFVPLPCLHARQVAHYVDTMFALSDVNKDGSLSFEEFVEFYNQLVEFIKLQLLNKNKRCASNRAATHTELEWPERGMSVRIPRADGRMPSCLRAVTSLRLREEFLEARSFKQHLESLPSELIDKKLWKVLHFGILGHEYDVEVRIPPDIAANTADARKWVRAQTLLEEKVDHFVDKTQLLGEPFSPIVSVELEGGTTLESPFTIVFPHCFGTEYVGSDACMPHRLKPGLLGGHAGGLPSSGPL